MKKIVPILALSLLSTLAMAKPVTTETLRRAAQNVLHRSNVVESTPASFTECRLFTGSDGHGFVLLSADDCVRPLLAYSMDAPFDTDDMPENLVAWINGYQRDIAAAKAMGIGQSAAIAEEWLQLENGTLRGRKSGFVQPLLTSFWKQSPNYNSMCPYDSAAGEHAVTGCMATSTAQVMRYWGHPIQGRGSHSYLSKNYGVLFVNYDSSFYDWENMPARIYGASPQVQRDAVAKLCYEVGVSMDMSYSPSGSGAYEHSGGMLTRFSAELALENHFGYNPAIHAAFKQGRSDEEWVALVSHELDKRHPIIYTGSSATSGHAFVVDGYDTNQLFHINWGWGGNSDGYYTIENLTIGQAGQSGYMAFNEMNNALLNVFPITRNDSIATVNVVSANPTWGTVSGSGTYDVNSPRVLLLASPKPGYRFSHWASGNTANPIFFFPTIDYTDTAYFVPLRRDTLGYCMETVPNFDTVFSKAHCEWGIRIPASLQTAGRELTAVQNFIYTSGDYILRIYLGDEPTTPVYEDTAALQSHGWRTVTLREPVALDATQTLWITFATEGVIYAEGITPYTGVQDGSWLKHDGVWEKVDTSTIGYYTWSIRGITQSPTGISEIADDGLNYRLQGLHLSVNNPQGLAYSVYDITGRQLTKITTQNSTFTLPAPGVYLLQAEGHPAHRIIAVR